MTKTHTKQKVEMEEMAFSTNPYNTLFTLGVCTCIAFVIRGSYWDDLNDEQVRFCGLYHWSGFGVSKIDPDRQTADAFKNFLEEIRDTFDLPYETPIAIKKLEFIGGEKMELGENQEIILTGTEAEVHSLQKIVQNFDFEKHHFTIDPQDIRHQHFLTRGDQSIEIHVSPFACSFTIDEGEDDEAEDDMEASFLYNLKSLR